MIEIPDHELAPEIDRCPACGMMVCDRHPVTGARERRNVRAECLQKPDAVLSEFLLRWYCNACGCWWRHGQFEEVAKLTHCQLCGDLIEQGKLHDCKENVVL